MFKSWTTGLYFFKGFDNVVRAPKYTRWSNIYFVATFFFLSAEFDLSYRSIFSDSKKTQKSSSKHKGFCCRCPLIRNRRGDTLKVAQCSTDLESDIRPWGNVTEQIRRDWTGGRVVFIEMYSICNYIFCIYCSCFWKVDSTPAAGTLWLLKHKAQLFHLFIKTRCHLHLTPTLLYTVHPLYMYLCMKHAWHLYNTRQAERNDEQRGFSCLFCFRGTVVSQVRTRHTNCVVRNVF